MGPTTITLLRGRLDGGGRFYFIIVRAGGGKWKRLEIGGSGLMFPPLPTFYHLTNRPICVYNNG